MSSMLEQAIVDAAALREAALKNAEHALIEKYAPQIKEAVNSLLEQDMATPQPEKTSIDAPFAASPMSEPNQPVELTISDEDQTWEFDLEKLKQEMGGGGKADVLETEEEQTTEDLIGELGIDEPAGGEAAPTETPGMDLALQEILNLINDMEETQEVLEEELVVDMAGQEKNGTFETNATELNYQQEMELARKEATKHKEEKEELENKIKELSESLSKQNSNNKKLFNIVKKLEKSLNETFLSNAKLLYSNNILSDASLNERQKSKIVEAIAKAKTVEEAKNLQETLKTTVGSTKSKGPQSLSETVQRKSNLSSVLSRRKQPVQEHSFSNRMKKLAGIQ